MTRSYHTTRVALPHLRAWRMYKLLSLSELFEATGVARSTIVNLENGKTTANLTTVGRLAQGLGVDRRQLVYDQPPNEQGSGAENR